MGRKNKDIENFNRYLSLLTSQILLLQIPGNGIRMPALYKAFSVQIEELPTFKYLYKLHLIDPMRYITEINKYVGTLERFNALVRKGGLIKRGKTYDRFFLQICKDLLDTKRRYNYEY